MQDLEIDGTIHCAIQYTILDDLMNYNSTKSPDYVAHQQP